MRTFSSRQTDLEIDLEQYLSEGIISNYSSFTEGNITYTTVSYLGKIFNIENNVDDPETYLVSSDDLPLKQDRNLYPAVKCDLISIPHALEYLYESIR